MELIVKDIVKKFNGVNVLDGVSTTFKWGNCYLLLGQNGAGKSTLIQIIADILTADEGHILLDGQKISAKKDQIGYLPQYPNFFSWMTAFETLLFMGTLSGLSKTQLQKDIPLILAKVGLAKEAQTKVGTFSGGMKQRLGIAQAILHKPTLIIMDEPVSALDPIGRREVLNLLKEIKKETTILLSTHILADAEEICERFVVIKEGQKIEDATKSQLLNRSQESAIYLTIRKEDYEWLKQVEHFPYVKGIENIGDGFKISVHQVEEDAYRLLQHGLDQKIAFTKFEIGVKESLEEIFLALVVEV